MKTYNNDKRNFVNKDEQTTLEKGLAIAILLLFFSVPLRLLLSL
jgi:hypothetical protein